MNNICSIFTRINKRLQKIELFFGTFSIFALVVIMLSNAAGRYLFKMPILWADEMNNFLFIWFGFLGCSYIMGNDEHMRVTELINLLPKTLKFIITQLMNVIMIVMFAFFVVATFKLLGKVTFSGIMRIPLKYIYFILPLSFGLMCFHILNNILQGINSFIIDKKEEPKKLNDGRSL